MGDDEEVVRENIYCAVSGSFFSLGNFANISKNCSLKFYSDEV
jgi:hypothetical protein